jgi:hypothetical protein
VKSARQVQVLLLLLMMAAYGGAVLLTGGLSFGPFKDEEQLWEQVETFARDFPPGIAELRSYREPMTPVAFLIWAGLEHWHHGGIAAARVATIVASFAVLLLIALQQPAPGRQSPFAGLSAFGLFLYPYWFPTSMLVYTDVPASLFVACGFACYLRERHLAGAAFLALAIATRQYAVTFPLAVAAYEGVAALRAKELRPARWLPYLAAAATLLAWFVFFGGFSPTPSLEPWPRHSDALRTFRPSHALHALSALGIYFVAIEFMLDRRRRQLLRIDRRAAIALAVGVGLFAVFTPYIPKGVGLLNRALHFLIHDAALAPLLIIPVQLAAMAATLVRFSRGGLGTWVLAANVAIMPFTWAPWEKYYMPILVALWMLAAAGAIDGPPGASRGGPVAPGDRVGHPAGRG